MYLVIEHWVGHCNGFVEFKFYDKSLYTKNDSQRRRSNSPLSYKYIDIIIIIIVNYFTISRYTLYNITGQCNKTNLNALKMSLCVWNIIIIRLAKGFLMLGNRTKTKSF